MYIVKNYDFGIKGQNNNYLVREDYSLVNKTTGEVIEKNVINTITKKTPNNKLHINGVATVSKNKRYFISQPYDWSDSVAEVDKNGKITKLQEFYTSLSLNIPSVKAMIASDDGNYLYIIIEKYKEGRIMI